MSFPNFHVGSSLRRSCVCFFTSLFYVHELYPHPHQMLEGLADAVDDVALGTESDRFLLDPQFELRALIGYVDMFRCETFFFVQ